MWPGNFYKWFGAYDKQKPTFCKTVKYDRLSHSGVVVRVSFVFSSVIYNCERKSENTWMQKIIMVFIQFDFVITFIYCTKKLPKTNLYIDS